MRLVEIGQHLREQRRARGMTQRELATKAGVTRGTVNRIESGADSDIGVKKLFALLEAVGSSLHAEPTRTDLADPIATVTRLADRAALGVLYPDELIQAVLTGQPAPHKAALIQIAIEELDLEARRALAAHVGRLVADPQRAELGLARLERHLGTESPSQPTEVQEGEGGLQHIASNTA